jgi:1-deoxy-D-xylulose-5-phosphate synthase
VILGMVLERINDPGILKKLSPSELEQLAKEIREMMLNIISCRGGHLASSLGVVELTIALHRVFNTPDDKIIWDVGHQCYPHKILTGRKDKFPTIRDFGGLSGFPKRQESIFDTFDVGHSSTSISAALGMALARDLQKKDFSVVAVIGDGALTGGMAFEALNYAGHIKTNITVVLNDNEMSISKNVGGLPSYLARIRTDPKYFRLKEDFELIMGRIPAIGKSVVRSAERIKDRLKYLIVPGVLFEELGFTYLGPIDGHNVVRLGEMLSQAKSLKGPVLLHVVTQKGKGYSHAEKKPHQFHGIGPFDKKTGEVLVDNTACPAHRTYSEIFGSTLLDEASRDSSIVAITAAMPAGTGLGKFFETFPDRAFDVGIAEQHAVTMAAGLAIEGMKPVVAIYSTFLQRAYDQLLQDVCMQKLPVVFALDRAGIVGGDGESHNGLYDFSYLRPMQGMVIMAPSCGMELASMLKTALTLKCPTAIRFPRGKSSPPSALAPLIPPGKGELLKKGKDLLILAIGSMVGPALEAHRILAHKGISCCVINARFVKPLDRDLICSWARKCRRVLIVEEHLTTGGFGSAVLEMFNEEGLTKIHLNRMGLTDPFTGQGGRDNLLSLYNLTGEGIALEAEGIFFGRRGLLSRDGAKK